MLNKNRHRFQGLREAGHPESWKSNCPFEKTIQQSDTPIYIASEIQSKATSETDSEANQVELSSQQKIRTTVHYVLATIL